MSARIVPRSYIRNPDTAVLDRDSDVTRALIDECDYVVNIPPSEVTYPVSSVFTTLLVRYGEPLREQFDVTRAAEWPPDPVTSKYALGEAVERGFGFLSESGLRGPRGERFQ